MRSIKMGAVGLLKKSLMVNSFVMPEKAGIQ